MGMRRTLHFSCSCCCLSPIGLLATPVLLMNAWWGLWRRICEFQFPMSMASMGSILKLATLSLSWFITNLQILADLWTVWGQLSTPSKKYLYLVSSWRCQLFLYLGLFWCLKTSALWWKALIQKAHWLSRLPAIFYWRDRSNTLSS